MIKKLVLLSAIMTFIMAIQACTQAPPPPRDAKAISESDFNNDTISNPARPAAGGGKSLTKDKW